MLANLERLTPDARAVVDAVWAAAARRVAAGGGNPSDHAQIYVATVAVLLDPGSRAAALRAAARDGAPDGG